MAEKHELDLGKKLASASFTVSKDVCFSSVEETISLPTFTAPGEKDFSWVVRIKPKPAVFASPFNYRVLKLTCTLIGPEGRSLYCTYRVQVHQTEATEADLEVAGLKDKKVNESIKYIFKKFEVDEPVSFYDIVYVAKSYNKLSIQVDVMYTTEWALKSPNQSAKKRRMSRSQGQLTAISDFGSLLESGMLSDMTLCVAGEELPAHRAVLAARSDVFRAMLSTECAERSTGRVIIEDTSAAVVKELLRYFYTGCTSLGDADSSAAKTDVGFVLELLVAADRYMLSDLEELCLNHVAAQMEDDDSSALLLCDILRVSDLINAKHLRQVAVKYLSKHREWITKTDEWRAFCAENKVLAGCFLVDAMSAEQETEEGNTRETGRVDDH